MEISEEERSIKSDSAESYIVDKIFIKGVSADRDQNYSNVDYVVVDKNEDLGVRFYMHKYFIGHSLYYFMGPPEKRTTEENA